MNAVLPDDLSYYEQSSPPTATRVGPNELEADGSSSLWDGPTVSEMDQVDEMIWVGPEPLV